MKKYLTLLSILFLYGSYEATAQKFDYINKDDFVLDILRAEIDGTDYTDAYIENDAFLVFYVRNGYLYFANCWQKTMSQSYGEVSAFDYVDRSVGRLTAKFKWNYTNSYDDKQGDAIGLIRLTDWYGVRTYELQILTEYGRHLLFKGNVNDMQK